MEKPGVALWHSNFSTDPGGYVDSGFGSWPGKIFSAVNSVGFGHPTLRTMPSDHPVHQTKHVWFIAC